MENKEVYKGKSKQLFDNQANNYEATRNGKHAQKLYSGVVENVSKFNCERVLDVGCGTGTVLSLLAINESIGLSGVDLSEKMIAVAQKKLGNRVELKIGDSEKLPWEANTFDGIVCTDSFHHYPNPKQVLNEMARVLNHDGYLIIGDPWMMMPLRVLTNPLLKYGNSGDYRIYSKKEISKMLLECGFVLMNWSKVNHKSFIVTAKISKN
jgi:ubiquinone/menaquinone biosynthesis C-methylase UbiE